MKPETSQFESSEILATFLASTSLLEESWKLCTLANTAAQQGFTVDRVGETVYVSFSGVQMVNCSDESLISLVELENCEENGIFNAFSHHVEGRDEPVMVHAGLLQLFLAFYHTQDFQQKMLQILNESKSVVYTGHSLGGALASLSALWLLSYTQSTSPCISIFCITYGSPMLGNESFSQAILQERWGGNFVHIVSQNDILPRLLFAPSSLFNTQLSAIFQYWHWSMTSRVFMQLDFPLSDEKKIELFNEVLACVDEARVRGGAGKEKSSQYWPFGSYMFCTEKGAICLDNATAIVEMLYLMMDKGSDTSCVEDHFKYGFYVGKLCWQYLQKSGFMEGCISESSNESGIALALQSSGVSHQEPEYVTAKNSLKEARHIGFSPNLNNAKMAVSLAKITPLRAQIEWYKSFCDNSDDHLGYYDTFKKRGASKRDSKVNMNRLRLGEFWDKLINELETNKLTHDFHKLSKYVNASQFYKLLVEPLEIAEYYGTCMHKKNGHYIEHGREKRFKIFDKWWKDRKIGDEESNPRSDFASLTQDSCFWARVEEARDCIFQVTVEIDLRNRFVLLEKIEKFEIYASEMVEKKDVSVDVLAGNSSYNMFRKEWGNFKSQMHQLPTHFPDFQDRMVQ